MDDQRNHRQKQQDVNQSARDVKHQKPANPKNGEQNGNPQERSKPHDSSERKRAAAQVSSHSLMVLGRTPYGELRKNGGKKRAVRGRKSRIHVFPVLSMFFML
jgi:hypothetical protein